MFVETTGSGPRIRSIEPARPCSCLSRRPRPPSSPSPRFAAWSDLARQVWLQEGWCHVPRPDAGGVDTGRTVRGVRLCCPTTTDEDDRSPQCETWPGYHQLRALRPATGVEAGSEPASTTRRAARRTGKSCCGWVALAALMQAAQSSKVISDVREQRSPCAARPDAELISSCREYLGCDRLASDLRAENPCPFGERATFRAPIDRSSDAIRERNRLLPQVLELRRRRVRAPS